MSNHTTNDWLPKPGEYAIEIVEARKHAKGHWLARIVHAEGERKGWTICWERINGLPRDAADAERAARAMVGVHARVTLVRTTKTLAGGTTIDSMRVASWEPR